MIKLGNTEKKDEKLITEYLLGNEKSLELLIRRYLKPVYGFVHRHTNNPQEAEDITQEVFIRMWRNIRKFNRKKSFKTWIFSITKNASIDFLRKKKAIAFSEFENEKGRNIILEKIAVVCEPLEEIISNKILSESLSSVSENLSSRTRTIFNYRYHKNLTFREIADILGESINTVKSRYRRGVIEIKRLVIKI